MIKDVSHTISMVFLMTSNLFIKLVLIDYPSGTFGKSFFFSRVDRTISTVHMPDNGNNTIKILIIYSIEVYSNVFTSVFIRLILIYNIAFFIFPMVKFVSSTISMELLVRANGIIEFGHGKFLDVTVGKVR